MLSPVAATLKATFIGACLRTTAKMNRVAAAALRTSRLGIRKANPMRSGPSSSTTSVVLPRKCSETGAQSAAAQRTQMMANIAPWGSSSRTGPRFWSGPLRQSPAVTMAREAEKA